MMKKLTNKYKQNRLFSVSRRNFFYPAVAAGLLLAFCVSFLQLWPALPHKEKVAANHLRVSIAYHARQCDGRLATDAASSRLLNFISKGLLRQNPQTFALEPAAATIVNRSPGMLELQLPAQEFHNGTPLTADWVVQYYEKLRDPAFASPWLRQALQVELAALAPNRLQVTYDAVNEQLILPMLTLPLTTGSAEECYGIADYQLTTPVTAGELELVKVGGNKNWGRITLQVQGNALTRMLSLQRGDVDVLFLDMPADYLHYARGRGFPTLNALSGSYSYLGVNFNPASPTADFRVRQALHLAIPRDKIMQDLLRGAARWSGGSLLLGAHPLASHAPPPEPDHAKAKELIASYLADQDGASERLELELMISNNETSHRVAAYLQHVLSNLNIDIIITPLQWGTLYERIKEGRFSLYYLSWVGPFDSDIYHRLFHSTQKVPVGLNRSGYASYEYDSLLNQMVSNNSLEVMHQVQQRHRKQLLDIPLWRHDHVLISAKSISGCALDPTGSWEGLLSCRRIKKQ